MKIDCDCGQNASALNDSAMHISGQKSSNLNQCKEAKKERSPHRADSVSYFSFELPEWGITTSSTCSLWVRRDFHDRDHGPRVRRQGREAPTYQSRPSHP